MKSFRPCIGLSIEPPIAPVHGVYEIEKRVITSRNDGDDDQDEVLQ